MYGLHDYARMLWDDVRLDAYAGALAEVVRPDSVVVDIGAGTGAMALMACKLGARRVFAIETSEAIAVAEDLAVENGVEDRLEIIKADSRSVDLPERAHVIVSDLRGVLPMFGKHLEVLADARRRFLAPGGVVLPSSDALWASPVECAGAYERHLGRRSLQHGVTLDAMRRRLGSLPAAPSQPLGSETLLAEPARWATLDYTTAEARPVEGRAEWRVTRGGSAHGILVWFEASLGSSRGYQTGPGHERVYRNQLLPLEGPLVVNEGDRLAGQLWVGPEGEPWAWSGSVTGPGGKRKSSFKQSSLQGAASRPWPRESGRAVRAGSD